ncbi:MAG: hypothetical protein MI739_10655, partial [Bacteroidales bacterium]|nr:hypothetical protein [Bacteroidales bacterium]
MNIKRYILAGAVATASLFSACTDGFEEMNKDRWASRELSPRHQFALMQAKMWSIGHEGWRGNIITSGPISGVSACLYGMDEFYESDDFFSATWNLIYTDVAKEITDVF